MNHLLSRGTIPGSSRLKDSNVSTEDRDLILDCLSGNTAAYSELVHRYQDRLFNVLYQLLGSTEDAQDVVQETFLSAYQGLSNFKHQSQFFTWLYRIAKNHAIDFVRKKRPIVTYDSRPKEDIQPADDSAYHRPEEMMQRAERDDQLRQALKMLSEDHREVLILKDFDDMKYEDIAEVLGIPIGTVRSRIHRARIELREILERMEYSWS